MQKTKKELVKQLIVREINNYKFNFALKMSSNNNKGYKINKTFIRLNKTYFADSVKFPLHLIPFQSNKLLKSFIKKEKTNIGIFNQYLITKSNILYKTIKLNSYNLLQLILITKKSTLINNN